MQGILPRELPFVHEIEYQTRERVPLDHAGRALLATHRLFQELPDLFEGLFPGVKVVKIEVAVDEVSEGSLREILWGIIFVTFQDDLVEEIPDMLEKLTGLQISDSYDTIVAALVVLLLYYCAEFVYKKVTHSRRSEHLAAQLDGMIADVARQTGQPEAMIRDILSKRYGPKRVQSLARTAIDFFRPSRGRSAYPIRVGANMVPVEAVRELPMIGDDSDVASTSSQYHQDVDVHVVAQNLYSPKSWWAEIPSIWAKKLPLHIVPPLRPDEVYTRRYIRGDVLVILADGANGPEPAAYHLLKLST